MQTNRNWKQEVEQKPRYTWQGPNKANMV